MSQSFLKRFGARRMTAEELFLLHSGVASENGCIPWQGSVTTKGYGSIRAGGGPIRRIYAHRYAWMRANGPIPDNMLICHTCDNPGCVNLDHLFLGTAQDNTSDMIAKRRHQYGEQRPMAKLTGVQVRQIRADYANGVRQMPLAKQYGVNQSIISQIVRYKIWSHV